MVVHQRHLDGLAVLDHPEHGVRVQIIPGGGDDAGVGMLLCDEGAALFHPVGAQQLRAAEDDGGGILHLIQEELTEVLHVHPALARVHHGGAAADDHLGVAGLALLHRRDNLAQLAHAGGLHQNTVGIVFGDQLVDGLLEVTGQGAADAAAVQLVHDDARILHEAAVHADLAIFIFQQNDLLALEGTRQQLLDEGRLARAQEAGDNVDLDHVASLLLPKHTSEPPRRTSGEAPPDGLGRKVCCSQIFAGYYSMMLPRNQARARENRCGTANAGHPGKKSG